MDHRIVEEGNLVEAVRTAKGTLEVDRILKVVEVDILAFVVHNLGVARVDNRILKVVRIPLETDYIKVGYSPLEPDHIP